MPTLLIYTGAADRSSCKCTLMVTPDNNPEIVNDDYILIKAGK